MSPLTGCTAAKTSWVNGSKGPRLCENSQFVPFWCRSFFEYDVFVAQLNERVHKSSHFRRFAAAQIVFTQPRPKAPVGRIRVNGWKVPHLRPWNRTQRMTGSDSGDWECIERPVRGNTKSSPKPGVRKALNIVPVNLSMAS